ncbi:hypothetical protein ACFL43_03920, partial [Thermodesulfobacteriota bacterium]
VVLLKKKGFVQMIPLPYLIIIAIIIVGIIAAPQISKLEILGFADDYLYYDDLERDFLDDNLWSVEQETYRYDTGKTEVMSSLVVKEGALIVSNKGGHDISPKVTLNPLFAFDGHFIKAKFKTRSEKVSDYLGRSFAAYSSVHIYLNDNLIYECSAKDIDDGYKTCLFEAVPSFEDSTKYSILDNGEEINQIDVGKRSTENNLKIIINPHLVSAQFYYLKYKYPYNCKIADDEVLVFDSFAAGSVVNISSLYYEPVKFCLDYPIKARSFEENGIKTDIRGEILQRIVRGESVIVPVTEEWKFYYITKYTSGMDTPCEVGQARDTLTGICVNPIEEAIVGCNTDSDCYIPLGCQGVSTQCISNKCEYEGACLFKPEKEEMSFWAKIMNNPLVQWISGLFDW